MNPGIWVVRGLSSPFVSHETPAARSGECGTSYITDISLEGGDHKPKLTHEAPNRFAISSVLSSADRSCLTQAGSRVTWTALEAAQAGWGWGGSVGSGTAAWFARAVGWKAWA
jgi:hypothetical protein